MKRSLSIRNIFTYFLPGGRCSEASVFLWLNVRADAFVAFNSYIFPDKWITRTNKTWKNWSKKKLFNKRWNQRKKKSKPEFSNKLQTANFPSTFNRKWWAKWMISNINTACAIELIIAFVWCDKKFLISSLCESFKRLWKSAWLSVWDFLFRICSIRSLWVYKIDWK